MVERCGNRLTYNEINVFGVGMSLELETQLVQIPDPHLRFVRPSSNSVMSIPSGPDLVGGFGEFEVLYKFKGAFYMFPLLSFPLL